MKHQYFGDINDFRKYGLLRILTGNGTKRLGICWMLTEDDNRTDGNFTRYLSEPHRWRAADPTLFDMLAVGVAGAKVRAISEPLLERLLPNTIFAADLIPDPCRRPSRDFTIEISFSWIRTMGSKFSPSGKETRTRTSISTGTR